MPQPLSLRFVPAAGPPVSLGRLRCHAGAVRFSLALGPALRIYGLGEKSGGLDRRGRCFVMANREPLGVRLGQDPLYQSHPFLLGLEEGSAFGLYLDCPAHSVFDLGTTEPAHAIVHAEQPAVDIYLLAGPSPKEVLEHYTSLVGRCELPPRWALGYHQSRWSYKSDAEVRRIASELGRYGLPCDAIHLDIDYLRGWRVFTWHPRRFPDPARLAADLRAQGLRLVAILDPGVKVERGYEVYEEGAAAGHFLRRRDGREYHGNVWPGTTAFPDFTRPEVRSWWAEQVGRLLGAGVAGIWNDMNEPAWWIPRLNLNAFRRGQMRPDDVLFDDGGRGTPFARLHNLYANLEAQATLEAFRTHRPAERPFVLTRAAFSGIQRHAAVWTGDIASRWPHLGASVPMLLGLGVSGVPFCGADIGGFAGSCTAELFARWIALGAFTPFCRNHTMKASRRQEPWSFGPAVTDIARRHLELRYRLLPYWVTLFKEASDTGLPPMRPLFLEFPSEPDAASVDDEFLLGPELLVAPVLERKQREREVYLPPGAWWEWRTGALHSGPGLCRASAPLEALPLFLRGGAILPLWPVRQHADGPLPETLGLLCHPDAAREGRLDLYDDEGDGYAYREGQYRLTPYSCRREPGMVSLSRGSHRGELSYAPTTVDVELVLERVPQAVALDGQAIAEGARGWRYDASHHLLRCTLSVPDGPWCLSVRMD